VSLHESVRILFQRLVLLPLILLLLITSYTFAGLEDDDWTELRSENFVIYSNAPGTELRPLARDLEHFRTIVLMFIGTKPATKSLPFRIIALKESSDLQTFFNSTKVAGFYFPSLRGHYAFLDLSVRAPVGRRRTQSAGRQVLLHEYVHYLTRNNSTIRYPRWYNEGLAEFLSTLTYDDSKATIGAPIVGRLQVLRYNRFIPLRRIVDESPIAEPVDIYRFYAQSWLLVHHLSTHPDLEPRLIPYLRRYSDGEDSIEAFESEFDISLSRLTRQLKRKVRNSRFKTLEISFKKPLEIPNIQSKPLRGTEKRLMLADAYSTLGHKSQAHSLYEQVIRASPLNAQATAGLADLRLRDSDLDGAADLLKQLPEDAPSVPLLIARGDHQFASQTKIHKSHNAMPGIELKKARDFYLAALRLDPNSAEAYFSYGLTYLGSTEDSQEGVNAFTQTLKLLPAHTPIQIYEAVARLQLGDNEAACILSREISQWARTTFEKEAAAKIAEFCMAPSRSAARLYGYELVQNLHLPDIARE